MCGIAGALSFDRARFTVCAPEMIAMRDTMIHRGPDGEGIWIGDEGRIGRAHRRLAVIDLSEAGAQPMLSTDGRLVLVFNGEIYNHAALRAELIALGQRD